MGGRLNLTGAKLMHKYKARAAADVTGFGILGHAKNLAENQIKAVDFTIDTLPIIKTMVKISKGGAENFIKEIKDLEGCDAWIIGFVVEGSRTASLLENPTIIEV